MAPDSKPVKIIAHRGAWKKNNLPQNSIASLREAIRLQLDGSEFDVHMTADDSLVVNHDRVYQGLNIEKSAYRELAVHLLSNGEKIPTLREYLMAGRIGNNKTRLICELKPSAMGREKALKVAEKAVSLVRELGTADLVSYISFDYAIVKKITEIDPAADVEYLNGEKSPAELKRDGIRGLDYNISVFRRNTGWINDAREAGMILNVWTVNKKEDIEWAIDQRFNFITTDEPELAAEIISMK
jgi:glycerophosphoryl diester phosphodiesterase